MLIAAGDVVICVRPVDPGEHIIKRVAALGGEEVLVYPSAEDPNIRRVQVGAGHVPSCFSFAFCSPPLTFDCGKCSSLSKLTMHIVCMHGRALYTCLPSFVQAVYMYRQQTHTCTSTHGECSACAHALLSAMPAGAPWPCLAARGQPAPLAGLTCLWPSAACACAGASDLPGEGWGCSCCCH